MKIYSRVFLLSVVALFYIWPAGIFATDTSDTLTPGSHSTGGAPAGGDGQNSDEFGKRGDKGKGKSGSEDTPAGNAHQQDAEPTPDVLIKEVSVVVRNVDDEPVELAKVKLFTNKNAPPLKKLTDEKGVVTFNSVPAARLDVKVTAPHHTSYTGEINLESGDSRIFILLQKRK